MLVHDAYDQYRVSRSGGEPDLDPPPCTVIYYCMARRAHAVLSERLRQDIRDRRYPERLPTEAELVRAHGVSRHTVRRAFQDLVAEGVVYRVPGRGTFAYDGESKYLRSFGSIDDLLALSLDTEMEVVEPPHPRVDLDAAGRLRLDRDDVVSMTFRRFHEGQAFSVTTIFVPVAVGRRLMGRHELMEVGGRRRMTVLSVVREIVSIASAQQSITAGPAPRDTAGLIDVHEDDPVLRIDRLYFDRDQQPVELAINHCNPARYSYRVQLRAAER